jgi:hypothetical protein
LQRVEERINQRERAAADAIQGETAGAAGASGGVVQ